VDCNNKEYLKRFYWVHEFEQKNRALAEYYKYHRDFAYHMGRDVGLLMMMHQEHRNKYHRKFIKKLINEPSSLSSSLKSLRDSSARQPHPTGNSHYSTKLKGLDSQQSSVVLEEICQKISSAFQHIKPLYFYRGVYNDHAEEFRRFLILERDRTSKQPLREDPKPKRKDDLENESSRQDPTNTTRPK
jgi:hypothetical protein